MSLWRPWRRLSQEAITAKGEADFAKLPPYGTVPYHQHYVRFWVKSRRLQVLQIAFQMAMLMSPAGSFWWLRTVWGLLLVMSGSMLVNQSNHIYEHRRKAWDVETQATLEGMSESGMFDAAEAIGAMRDGPVPPGVRRKHWVRWHQDLLLDLASGDT